MRMQVDQDQGTARSARRPGHDDRTDAGAALVSALFVLVLMAALTAGLTALIITDTKVRQLDGTRTQAFYVAHAGLERLTAALGDLFNTNYAPTSAQINALTGTTPGLGATWQDADGTSGYKVIFPEAGGVPTATVMTVLNGPFQGLVGLATPFQMSVTARLADGSEAELTRTLQTVSIPVFQFGLFSENDLSFFAGPNFNFGGRVHSNSNVFLASGNGSTLTLSDRVTSVGEVIRRTLSNGWDTAVNYTGPVNVIQAPGTFRALAPGEGSLTGGLGTAQNEPTWTHLSTGDYNHNLMNGRTGARRLDLPILTFGGGPIDLIRRPAVNENVNNPNLLAERFYSMASLRILLSDTAADINGLPLVTAGAPVPLGTVEPWALLDSTHFPFAESPGPLAGAAVTDRRFGVRTPAGTPQLGGFIKIEKQTPAGVWIDVTQEILDLGISGRQIDVAGCVDPSPNAIVRLQRLRDGLNGGACVTEPANPLTVWQGINAPYNYSPMTLYDTREGVLRDATADTAPMQFGGIMHYVEVDVNNLRRWFLGQIGANGLNTMNITGYVLYFSDRRGNRNAANQETGEYGFEDIVNPASAAGTPNGVLDVGEDFNGNGTLEVYGQVARAPATVPGGAPTAWAALATPLLQAATPWSNVDPGNVYAANEEMAIAQRNPAMFYRRALKLTNGTRGNIIAPGLTVVAENPVYVQGNWNADNAGFGDPHVATAVIADSLTLLSNVWNDRTSFLNPHAAAPRNAQTTWYRLAVIAGKGPSFTRPGVGAPPQDYGTDGGAHNFLRYIEDWGGQTLNYRGSIASLYFSRQALGTYKCCADVYAPPTRGYNFDVEFLTPALLPPRTPMFRDVNITGFTQIIRP